MKCRDGSHEKGMGQGWCEMHAEMHPPLDLICCLVRLLAAGHQLP